MSARAKLLLTAVPSRVSRLLIVTERVFDRNDSRRTRETERTSEGGKRGGLSRKTLSRGTCECNAVRTLSQPPWPTSFILSPAPPSNPLRYALEVVTVISGCRRDFRAFASSTGFSLASGFGRRKISREGSTICERHFMLDVRQSPETCSESKSGGLLVDTRK